MSPSSDKPDKVEENGQEQNRETTTQAVESKDDSKGEKRENEGAKEQLPAVIGIIHYLVICCPLNGEPKALYAFSDEDVVKLIRGIHEQNDQQYLFVIRNGELGKILKTAKGLLVNFKVAGLKLKIRWKERFESIENGWIGE